MSFSPLLDQRPLIPNGSTDCGEACTWMVLNHLGHAVNIRDILAQHSSYTDIAEVQNLLIHFGLKGTSIIGGGFDNNDKLIIALIHDDAYANPARNGPYEHYIVVYGQDNHNVYTANPWGGRDIAYPLAQFNAAYIAAVVIPVSANQPAPAPAPQPIGFPPTLGGRFVPVSQMQVGSAVCKLNSYSVANIVFNTPFDHEPVVVACNGDANEAGGAGNAVMNVVAGTVNKTGFAVQMIYAKAGAGIPAGTLVRVNFVAG